MTGLFMREKNGLVILHPKIMQLRFPFSHFMQMISCESRCCWLFCLRCALLWSWKSNKENVCSEVCCSLLIHHCYPDPFFYLLHTRWGWIINIFSHTQKKKSSNSFSLEDYWKWKSFSETVMYGISAGSWVTWCSVRIAGCRLCKQMELVLVQKAYNSRHNFS